MLLKFVILSQYSKFVLNVYVIQNLQRSAFFQTDLFTHPPTQHLLIIASLASTHVIKVH